MGLAEVKRKQRLVGSAKTQNAAWTNDASLPGQRLLTSMGWNAGQGLGVNSEGSRAPITMALKLDNTGIGVDRAQREAKASNPNGVWFGANGELDALYAQLNAASTSGTPDEGTRSSGDGHSTSDREDVTPRFKRGKRVRRRDRTVDSPAHRIDEEVVEIVDVTAPFDAKESRKDGDKEKKKRKAKRGLDNVSEEKSEKKRKQKRIKKGAVSPASIKLEEDRDVQSVATPDEEEEIANSVSQYGVFQYLSNRLIVRRAQVRKQRGIFAKDAHIV